MTESDRPLQSRCPAGRTEVEPSDLPDHVATAVAEDVRLDLLLPQDLPTEHALSRAERAELGAVLAAFLQALRLSDRAVSLSRIEALLAASGDVHGRAARVEETGIPVNASQVDDFDSYFRVNRITSDEPMHALVRGLLQTARANMSLFCRAEHLPKARVEQQISGFIAYAHLLARTFGLGELS